MNLPLAILQPAVYSPADKFNGSSGLSPIAFTALGLLTFACAILLARLVMRARRQLPGADSFNAAEMQMADDEAVLRLKLSQWRASVFILITATALSLLVKWFDLLRWMPLEWDAGKLAYTMSDSLLFYPFTLGPVLIWHLADILERPRGKPRFLALLTSHALLTGMLTVLGLTWVMGNSRWFQLEGSCGGLFVILSETCIGLMPGLSFSFIAFSLALAPITLVKLAVALWSRLGPRP